MGQYHTVEQGEYLAQIARNYGFASWKTIWNASENKQLANERKNPNILYPGDRLFIPDRETKEESRATEKKHRFQLESDPLQLRIVLLGLNRHPLKDHECTLSVEGDSVQITTKADGLLQRDIPPKAATGILLDRFKPKPESEYRLERQFPLKIGCLDPVTMVSGQIARLNNLGYMAGEVPVRPFTKEEEEAKKKDPQFLSAVEEFQCDFSLLVDGKCGKQTQAKLEEVHGC